MLYDRVHLPNLLMLILMPLSPPLLSDISTNPSPETNTQKLSEMVANFICQLDWVMGARIMINCCLDVSVKQFWVILTFD